MRALFESGHRMPVLCRYGASVADGKRPFAPAGTALADLG
jgi:hypothetical protein